MTKTNSEAIATNYVVNGFDPGLDRVPMATFGSFKTYDRSEIESYRSIRNLFREYLVSSKNNQPISIAVFGAPGSGKTFGVNQVAKSIMPDRLSKIEFNLSQFGSDRDLISAFHKIRDIVLTGQIPIVFFDEFDSGFNGQLGWLKYFLAPMQKGIFREGETDHPIGKAIFVFAGGTSRTFSGFSGGKTNDPLFINAKGPDFVSRLRGFIDIKGPNPVDSDDRFFHIRRALFIRQILYKKAGHIFNNQGRLAVNEGVLRALIKIPEYKNGVRSIGAIVDMSMLSGRRSFEQAALPSREQLSINVDAELFAQLVIRDSILGGLREALAMSIHETFGDLKKGREHSVKQITKSWDLLDEESKESNR
ncbi:MAG: AAA family ATPase, partial [Chlorobiales bacterium]|nr:AAA family ATPase [Chlorobiales bacterium]